MFGNSIENFLQFFQIHIPLWGHRFGNVEHDEFPLEVGQVPWIRTHDLFLRLYLTCHVDGFDLSEKEFFLSVFDFADQKEIVLANFVNKNRGSGEVILQENNSCVFLLGQLA